MEEEGPHQVDGQADLGQLAIGGSELRLQLGGVGGGQDGLVQLGLWHAQALELLQQLRVGRQQRLNGRIVVKGAGCICRLGQSNQGVGACMSRPGLGLTADPGVLRRVRCAGDPHHATELSCTSALPENPIGHIHPTALPAMVRPSY